MKKITGMILTVMMLLGVVGCSDITQSAGSADTQSSDSASSVTYNLTDTGQSVSYDADGNEITPSEGEAFYGQDAQYEGTQASFTDNGDGTVTDNVTGLIWQQIPVSETMSWAEAEEYCESLELAGYDNWRVPTAKELFGISDFTTGWPYLDTDYFEFPDANSASSRESAVDDPQDDATGPPAGGAPQDGTTGPPAGGAPQNAETDTESADAQSEMLPPTTSDEKDSVGKDQGQFWSSNYYYVGTTHGGANSAFGVNQATGHIKAYPSDVTGAMGKHVRAVVGEVATENQFVDNGDGTISDLATGLMWMADDNGEAVEWEEALSYSENLEFAGYDDWKLPNVKELQSIVDYSGVYPAIDGTYFNCTELEENINYYFWTSTSAYFSTNDPTNYYAWYVAFGYAVDSEGNDTHGAGAVRFSAKYAESAAFAEGGDNYMNSVRCVRTID